MTKIVEVDVFIEGDVFNNDMLILEPILHLKSEVLSKKNLERCRRCYSRCCGFTKPPGLTINVKSLNLKISGNESGIPGITRKELFGHFNNKVPYFRNSRDFGSASYYTLL